MTDEGFKVMKQNMKSGMTQMATALGMSADRLFAAGFYANIAQAAATLLYELVKEEETT